jgi:hypothetical protein
MQPGRFHHLSLKDTVPRDVFFYLFWNVMTSNETSLPTFSQRIGKGNRFVYWLTREFADLAPFVPLFGPQLLMDHQYSTLGVYNGDAHQGPLRGGVLRPVASLERPVFVRVRCFQLCLFSDFDATTNCILRDSV